MEYLKDFLVVSAVMELLVVEVAVRQKGARTSPLPGFPVLVEMVNVFLPEMPDLNLQILREHLQLDKQLIHPCRCCLDVMLLEAVAAVTMEDHIPL